MILDRSSLATEYDANSTAISKARAANDKAKVISLLLRQVELTCSLDGPKSRKCGQERVRAGEVLVAGQRHADAIEMLTPARNIYSDLPSAPLPERAAALVFLAMSHQALGNRTSYRDVLLALVPLFSEGDEPDEPSLAQVWTEIATTYDEAIDPAPRAEALAKAKIYADIAATYDSADKIIAMMEAGDALARDGKLTEAKAALQTTILAARRSLGSRDMTTGRVHLRLGELYYRTGDKDAAATALRQAISSFDSYLSFPGERERAVVLLADMLASAGRLEEADDLLRSQFDDADNYMRRARLALGLAENLVEQGRFQLAARFLDPLHAEMVLYPLKYDRGLVGLVQRQRARIARAAGDWVETEKRIEGGFEFVGYLNSDIENIADVAIWAQARAMLGKRALAAEMFEVALERIRENKLELVATAEVAEIKLLAGQFYRQDPAESERARTLLMQAYFGAELMRIDAQSDELSQLASLRREALFRPLFMAIADHWFQAGVTVANDGDAAVGFNVLQRAMVGTTTRATALAAARRVGGGLAGQLQKAEADLANAEQAISATLRERSYEAAQARTMLEQRLSAARVNRDALAEQVQAKFPDYFNLIRPGSIGLPAIQALLGETEAALLAVPAPDGVHVMAVTRDAVHWHKAAVPLAALETDIRRLLWFAGASVDGTAIEELTWQDEVPGTNAFDRTTGHRLYQQLIAPVLPTLQGKTHVFVSAGGALSRLPFSILVTAPPAGADDDAAALRDTRWLADDFALVHLPSLQSLYLQRTTPRASGSNRLPFVGIGDPALDGPPAARATRGDPAVSVAALRQLAQLPGTATELRAVSARYGKDALLMLRSEASETAVIAAPLSQYRVLSFATHALMAGEVGGAREAGLVLSPPSEVSASDDGYLAMSEITALRLDADWVILSACNSAGDDGSVGATGLSGLARAFFFAGAQNLLASHWPVLDAAAPPLIIDTLDPAMASDRATALQQAMRNMRQRPGFEDSGNSYSHPRVWAPFVLIGDWR